MGVIAMYLRVSKNKPEDYIKDSGTLKKDLHDYNLGASDGADFNLVDIDKAWTGLFYLLTGESADTPKDTAIPLRWILEAPQCINSELDLGYAPALYTTSEQTKEVCSSLNGISDDALRSRYDVELMNELRIYPFEDGDWDEEAFDYLLQAIQQLKSFYNIASAESEAVIIFFG